MNIWPTGLRPLPAWQRAAVDAGFGQDTAKRLLARAFFTIAVGLTRERRTIVAPQR